MAVGGGRLRHFVLRRGRLVDPHKVARRVADGEVPRAPRLLGRLFDDLGARVAHLLEGRVEVLGVEVDAVEGALGDEAGDRLLVGGLPFR
ncbi:MAG TPA: hypothetical protein VN179_04020 [Solirubrobacterales bacterium]|nr:hypothetical protein [Solirubrobacterales bacterium]